MTDDADLLARINKAVAEHNAAEQAVTTAQSELVSKSKLVGQLLLEAKKRHPKVADFEAFLKRVNGLKLSRAYDLLRLAGGRTTDEELRQETRDRVRKHRAKKKLPAPKPISVTDTDVTESPKQIPKRITQSPEISPEEWRAKMGRLDGEPESPRRRPTRLLRRKRQLAPWPSLLSPAALGCRRSRSRQTSKRHATWWLL